MFAQKWIIFSWSIWECSTVDVQNMNYWWHIYGYEVEEVPEIHADVGLFVRDGCSEQGGWTRARSWLSGVWTGSRLPMNLPVGPDILGFCNVISPSSQEFDLAWQNLRQANEIWQQWGRADNPSESKPLIYYLERWVVKDNKLKGDIFFFKVKANKGVKHLELTAQRVHKDNK